MTYREMSDEADRSIDDALTDAYTVLPEREPGVVTGWVVIFEVTDGDRTWLHGAHSDGMPYWKTLGIVEAEAATLKHALTHPDNE